jgi:hypothetical protein
MHVDGRIKSKLILDWGRKTKSCDSAQGSVTSCCENGNERPISKITVNFLGGLAMIDSSVRL